MHRVYVYGSLKQGLGNHPVVEKSLRHPDTCIPGNFRMISLGGFPGVLESEAHRHCNIVVEAYSVSDQTLENLDLLESEGDFYHRKTFKDKDGIEGFMYILDQKYEESGLEEVDYWQGEDGVRNYEW